MFRVRILLSFLLWSIVCTALNAEGLSANMEASVDLQLKVGDIKGAIDVLRREPDQKAVGAWIVKNEAVYPPPFLYEVANYQALRNNNEAYFWFYLADLRSIGDFMRYDMTQALEIQHRIYLGYYLNPKLQELLAKTTTQKEKFLEKAKRFDFLRKHYYDTSWPEFYIPIGLNFKKIEDSEIQRVTQKKYRESQIIYLPAGDFSFRDTYLGSKPYRYSKRPYNRGTKCVIISHSLCYLQAH